MSKIMQRVHGIEKNIQFRVKSDRLPSGTDLEEYFAGWNNGFTLSNERTTWKANM